MLTHTTRLAAVVAVVLVTSTACSRTDRSSATAPRPGQAGTTYLVTVSRQAGGTVSSGADGKILCGTGATATKCGPAAYAWNEVVTLTATADAGKMFGTWAGDCSGRTKSAGAYVCTLDTTQYGADKYVVPVFGEPGRTQHANFNDPKLHGAAFREWRANTEDAFECKYCHGASYRGAGIALSCNDCHERAGFPGQADCSLCHDSPPSPAPVGNHPPVSSAITDCAGCHPETVDRNGAIIPGGKHMDGAAQAAGGHGDWTSPALHGPKFFDFGAVTCANCHGQTYGQVMNTAGESCNSCHAAAGWTAWQTNCSFCHGEKNPVSQLGGYDLASNPMWSAPNSGAHQAHLASSVSGGRFAAPFACATCHAVPGDLSHINGSTSGALVTLTGAGRANLPQSLGEYEGVGGTCTTYCHGQSAPSPAWSATGLQCGACHALPPPPSSGHPSVSTALKDCAVCHADTMKADGTLNLAGGAHIDGRVQASGSHGDYALPAVHGPKFFGFIAGAGGDCRMCHGAQDAGGLGPSCNACHSGLGWTSWQTNCSFCHGQKNTESQRGGYDLAAHPMWAAPATGAHQAHLTGAAAGGGLSFAAPFRCATCHAVPSDLSHIGGAEARATVALSGAGQVSLPASLGSYDPAIGTCTTYCHGSAASPTWTTTGLACGACHGLPPPASGGHPTVTGGLSACSPCHAETVNANGTLNVAGGKHVDGAVQASGHPNYTSPALHGPEFFKFLAGTATSNCQSCHGVTYNGGSAPSCNGCHSTAGWANWQTNCSFCHGARNATTKGGYVLAQNPTWSAPPDSVQQRLGAGPQPTRTGAHQAHLTGRSQGTLYSGAFKCDTCHTVPGDLAHAAGPERAAVVLSGSGQALLPQNLGTYDPASGTCTTYCHGTTLSGASPPNTKPAWGGPAIQCGNCHGSPPPTGKGPGIGACQGSGCHGEDNLHDLHTGLLGTPCADCHYGTVNDWPPYQFTGVHVNGAKDVQFKIGGVWNSTTGACTAACHGQAYQWR